MTGPERVLLIVSTVLTGGTGTVYGLMKYLLTPVDPYAVINHPWQPVFLKMHILAAPLLVFSLGLVFRRHVIDRYRGGSRSGRRSGILITGLFLPMVLSGYLIQVFTSGALLQGTVLTHLVTGGAFLAGLVFHRGGLFVLFPLSTRGSLGQAPEPCRESTWRDRSST